jgi:hypothetical protein
MPQGDISKKQIIWAIGSIAQLSRIPFDPELLAQSFPPPYAFSLLTKERVRINFPN